MPAWHCLQVAAYVLDHDRFAGVPATALVSCQGFDAAHGEGPHRAFKVGSLQEFIRADSDCEEHGFSAFPVREVSLVPVFLCSKSEPMASRLSRYCAKCVCEYAYA